VNLRRAVFLLAVAFIGARVSANATPPVLTLPTVEIIHSFTGADGSPSNGVMSLGPFGSVFGVASWGGTTDEGTVWYVDANEQFHLVHSFDSGTGDGTWPSAVVRGPGGWIYGTTQFGGQYGCGTLFRVRRHGGIQTVHTFNCVDGNQPMGNLVFQDGYLYGTTLAGGPGAMGNVYRMSPNGTVTTIHAAPSMWSNEGPMYGGVNSTPEGDLLAATTGMSAPGLFGAVLKINPNGTAQSLHYFQGQPDDGSWTVSAPVVSGDGVIYGATSEGGYYNLGTLYKITPDGEYTVIMSFGGTPESAFYPIGGVTLGSNGKLYGVAALGGLNYAGVIYEYTPAQVPGGPGDYREIYYFPGGADGFGGGTGSLIEVRPGVFYGLAGRGEFGFGVLFKMTL
jgi:uncharacterized repeat protein (TIGR03803 family)